MHVLAPAHEKYYEVEITRREEMAPDLWRARVRCEGDFKFVPGQYATLGIETGGKRVQRPYSIVSAPFEEELEFFFELVPHGALTPLLYKLQPGERLLMRKEPKGHLVLEMSGVKTNHLLVSTVTGVAPFVSYVRALYRDWKDGRFDGAHKLFLLNGASHPWEFGYVEELRKFAEEVPWFEYVATVSRPWDHAEWTGETGRVDDLLRKYADAWGLSPSNTVAYLCGHPEMIERSKGILQRRGFADKRAVKEEVYWVPSK